MPSEGATLSVVAFNLPDLPSLLSALQQSYMKLRQLSVLGDIDCNSITARRGFFGGGSVPVGGILPYLGTTAPTGYLLLDGTTVSGTVYPALFGAVDPLYKSGTNIVLPDLRGRTPVGAGGNGVTLAAGSALGSMPSHNHDAGGGVIQGGGVNANITQGGGQFKNGVLPSVGSGTANLPPYVGVNWIVRAL